MPTITKKKNDDGSTSFVAQVRIKPYNPTSKTFPDRKAAVAWAEDLERTLKAERARGAARADVASMTFGALIEEYLKDPETKALSTYHSHIEAQCAWWIGQCGATRAIELGPVVIRRAREALLNMCGPSTTNRYLATARRVVNFGRAAALLPTNCLWPPGMMLTEPKHRERFLTDDELSRVLTAAEAHSPLMGAAVLFAIGVGCRQSEQLRVRWADIDEKSRTVAIAVTKTDTSRRAHCPPAVIAALKALHGKNVMPLPTRFVFPHADGTAYETHELVDRWEKIREVAKVPDVRWHDLRHASASFLIQNGASLAEVAHQLGHKSVLTSKRYAHLVPGVKPTGADELNKKLRRP